MRRRAALGFVLVVAVGLVAVSPARADLAFVEAFATVTTSSTAVVAAPASGQKRRLLILANDSDTAAYCNLSGGAAVLNRGLPLAARAVLILSTAVPSGAVACIVASGSSVVLAVTVDLP